MAILIIVPNLRKRIHTRRSLGIKLCTVNHQKLETTYMHENSHQLSLIKKKQPGT